MLKDKAMKNFFQHFPRTSGLILPVLGLLLFACSKDLNGPAPGEGRDQGEGPMSMRDVAYLISSLPIGTEQMGEVYDAVSSSSVNGYDEEYMMRDLILSPGAGVGDGASTKASRGNAYGRPLRSLIEEHLRNYSVSRAGSQSGTESFVQARLDALAQSGLQIYWPYSEEWDGVTMPLVTFDPGYGTESNYAYGLSLSEDGKPVVDSVYVDESLARERPVWVINRNGDSEYEALPFTVSGSGTPLTRSSRSRVLYLRSFKALRQYDSWFAGGSEFFVKIGCVNGFSASTEAELKLYSPSVTDFMIVVKRRDVGREIPYGAVLVPDFTSQMDKLAFLIHEDDGGTRTTWKCSAVVKIKSKSYGFEVEIPINERDDIVWRGQLPAGFFQSEDIVTGRFGDVVATFELE